MQSSSLRGNNGPRYRHLAEAAAPYRTLTVDKLTPIIGAELGGVDLSRPLPDGQFEEIERALAENLVIFFRDQHLSKAQHLAFGRRFGDLHVHPAAPHEPGMPEMMIIHADRDSPRANGEGWHSDVSCDLLPPMGSMLYIRTCPPHGGDTLFASMYAAYDALSDGLKRTLEGLRAVHSSRHVFGAQAKRGDEMKDRLGNAEAATQDAVHPMVITHPISGKKALYVNRGFTTHIDGWTVEESKPLLEYLYQHGARPEFSCRFSWAPGSMAFWDNRATWHLAVNDYHGHRRLMHRITLEGEAIR